MKAAKFAREARAWRLTKNYLSEIVDRIEREREREREHEHIVLTRHGRPAAVIMSPEGLAALEDTLEILSDPSAIAEIEAGREDLAQGRTIGANELRAKYLSR